MDSLRKLPEAKYAMDDLMNRTFNAEKNLIDHKQEIIRIFNENVRNKPIDLTGFTGCGAEGHWLENQMGIAPNSRNEPDLLEYEKWKLSKRKGLPSDDSQDP